MFDPGLKRASLQELSGANCSKRAYDSCIVEEALSEISREDEEKMVLELGRARWDRLSNIEPDADTEGCLDFS